MYDKVMAYEKNERKMFNKEAYDRFIRYNADITGYFVHLINEGYEFRYEVTLRLSEEPSIYGMFFSSDIGELEFGFDTWMDKLTVKDYRKHKMGLFPNAESLINYFKEVYFPILEAENKLDSLKGEKSND